VEVLRMKAEGYSDREIAKSRGVKLNDVYNIIAKIRETVADMRFNAAVK
jgi:DNA-binding CsgD family transcriptional regulator